MRRGRTGKIVAPLSPWHWANLGRLKLAGAQLSTCVIGKGLHRRLLFILELVTIARVPKRSPRKFLADGAVFCRLKMAGKTLKASVYESNGN